MWLSSQIYFLLTHCLLVHIHKRMKESDVYTFLVVIKLCCSWVFRWWETYMLADHRGGGLTKQLNLNLSADIWKLMSGSFKDNLISIVHDDHGYWVMLGNVYILFFFFCLGSERNPPQKRNYLIPFLSLLIQHCTESFCFHQSWHWNPHSHPEK